MKIAIVVHGRFHSFDLARAFLKRGHDVTVLTNYPKRVVRRFGIPPERVRSFVLHGILSRIGDKVYDSTGIRMERFLNPMFGAWAERQLRGERWDVVHVFSGVAEELLRSHHLAAAAKNLVRGSAHIRTQSRILAEEQKRTPCRLDQPDRWIIEREEREYEMANVMVVLSRFAYNSFLAEGIDKARLRMLPLGSSVEAFRPSEGVIRERRARILSGAPLRVLYVGTMCFRKGLADLRELVEGSGERFQFRFIGPVAAEARSTVSALRPRAEFVPRRPQSELPKEYSWGDVLIFPTIEDGYAVILAQANAAALPILTTPNCAGPDMLQEGKTGWILPIRCPQAFADRLDWCDSHREELAEMVTHAYDTFKPRDWSDVAADFEEICNEVLATASPGAKGTR